VGGIKVGYIRNILLKAFAFYFYLLLVAFGSDGNNIKAYGSGSAFVPVDFDTLSGKVNTRILTLNEREYALSVATETPDIVRLYEIDLLSKMS